MEIRGHHNNKFEYFIHGNDFEAIKTMEDEDAESSFSENEALDTNIRFRDMQGYITINNQVLIKDDQELVASRN